MGRTNLLLAVFLLASLFSCKKLFKESGEKIGKEIAEEVVAESGEWALKKLSKRAIKTMSWDDLLSKMDSEMPSLAVSLRSLNDNLQQAIYQSIRRDPQFLNDMISSRTTVDEFVVFTQHTPSLGKSGPFFQLYVRSKCTLQKTGRVHPLLRCTLKEEGGIAQIIDHNGALIGEMRNGMLTLKNPFKSGGNFLTEGSLLREDLLPNTVYKIKGNNGLMLTYTTNDVRQLVRCEGKGLSADEFINNVVRRTDDVALGDDWQQAFKQVKQASKGSDVSYVYTPLYEGESLTPKHVKVEIKTANKTIVSNTFTNVAQRATYSAKENTALIAKYTKKIGIDDKKVNTLLSEMEANENLAKLIHTNPDVNIQRWLNTRNPVNGKLISRLPNGRMPINAKEYAGNVFYFHPDLNPKLKSRLISTNGVANLKGANKQPLTYDDLVLLDKRFPEGVPFTKEGFPDFSKVATKDSKGNVIRINIGKLSGDSKKDINMAETLYQKQGYSWEDGYTWHHIENTTELLRVYTPIHQLVDHSGGMATSR